MTSYSEEAKAIQRLMSEAKHVLAISHVGPDGDAIGSLTAMAVAIKQLGRQATMACDNGAPARFGFLPHVNRVQTYIDPQAGYDLVIALDCGDMSRMGRAFSSLPEPRPPIVNIDHHVTNTYFGEVNIVDGDCNSTTEILYRLLPQMGVQVSPDLATSLLTGIVTDTLGFRTEGVSSATFEAASALMEAGADLGLITVQALLIKPMSTLRLWQVGLNNMKLEDVGFLWTSISLEERRAIGHVGSSSGGLVNMLANADEAAMSAVLLEDEDRVYVGFRCRPPYNVAELALNLGGGGHPLAAGCTLDGSLNDVESLVVSMSSDAIRQQRDMLKNAG